MAKNSLKKILLTGAFISLVSCRFPVPEPIPISTIPIDDIPTFIPVFIDIDNYLSQNPLVRDYINNLDNTTRDYFYSEFNELNTTGNIILNPPETDGYGNIFPTDIKKIQSAKIARSVWIDGENLVPWKLVDYSTDELDMLFNDTSFYFVKDSDPMYAYDYSKNYLKNNKLDTISSIIDSLRRYRHRAEGDSFSGVGTLEEVLKNNVVNGCHASSQMMANLITSLNIPAYYRYNPETQNWFVGGHGELVVNEGYISHGDFIYGTTLWKAIPSKELIIPLDILQKIRTKETDPSYQWGSGRNKIEQRYMFDLVAKYPPDMSNSNTYATCLEYAHELGDGVATEEEIINMAKSWNGIGTP